MTHYLIELAIWILIAFFLGCLIGYLLRGMLGSRETVSRTPPALVETPAPQPVAPAVAPVTEATAAPVLRMDRPRGLTEPRDGKPDNLQRISGIGPKNDKILQSLGFFHFDQIAAWTGEQVAWVDDHLRFNGRITREKWIEQAELLASGNEEEFTRRFGPKS